MNTTRGRSAAMLVGVSVPFAVLAQLLHLGPAAAEPIGAAGSVTMVIPETPGDLSFTLEVNGQTYEYEKVDDSLSGTLTLTWAGSMEEPRSEIEGCPGGAPGGQIRLDEATPSAQVSATWASPSGQALIGPVEVSSREGFALASVCTDGEDAHDDPNEDPSGGDGGDGEPGEEPFRGCSDPRGNPNGHANGHGHANGNGNAGANGNGPRCDKVP